MKVLVTGAAGFIGFHLTEKLISEGYEVVGLDNLNKYYDVNLKIGRLKELGINAGQITYNQNVKSTKYPAFEFIKLNLEDREGMEKLFEECKPDLVCHMAAQAGVRYSITNPHVYIESNLTGFANLLEGCRKQNIKHLVYASSSSVYGLNENMPFSTSDNVDHPVSLYAATKKSNELMAHTYSYLFNIPTTGLRLFTVYGPWGRPDMAYFLFADAIIRNKAIKVFNHGKMSRDFTYVGDIVEGMSKVLKRTPAGQSDWSRKNPDPASSLAPYKIYNLGNNQPEKLLDFIEIIENCFEKEAIKEWLPLQPGDVESTYADVSGLVEDFGYKPKTSLKEGIKKFADWYKTYYKIDSKAAV